MFNIQYAFFGYAKLAPFNIYKSGAAKCMKKAASLSFCLSVVLTICVSVRLKKSSFCAAACLGAFAVAGISSFVVPFHSLTFFRNRFFSVFIIFLCFWTFKMTEWMRIQFPFLGEFIVFTFIVCHYIIFVFQGNWNKHRNTFMIDDGTHGKAYARTHSNWLAA